MAKMTEEERIAKRKAYQRDYYLKNKERLIPSHRESAKRWVENNPEKAKERMRAYYLEHKEEIAAKNAERYKERRIAKAKELIAKYTDIVNEYEKENGNG